MRGLFLLCVGVICAACCTPAPPPDPGETPELYGRRARATLPWFDAGARPVVRVTVPGDWHIAWHGEGGVVPLPHTVDAAFDAYFLRTEAGEPPAGDGAVVVELAGREVARWPARWTADPDARPAIAAARGHRQAGRFAEGREALQQADGDDALWVSVEGARLAFAEGRLGDAQSAWLLGAIAARQLGVTSEVSRRMAAAAFVAWRSRQLGAMDNHLEAAAVADGDDRMSIAWSAHLRGVLALELGDWSTAEAAFARADEAARRAGMRGQLRRIDESRALLLGELGRHGEALEILDALRSPDLPRAERGRLALNAGWSMLRAMGEGGREVDYAAVIARLDEAESEADTAEGAANLYANKAWVALLAGDRAGAGRWMTRARAADPQSASFAGPFIDLLEAKVALADGDWAIAEARFTAVDRRAIAEQGADGGDLGWRADLGRARAARGAGRLAEARAHLDRALERLDRAGASAALRRFRVPFFADRDAVVREAIDAALKADEPWAAFAIADRARGRLLRGLQRLHAVDRLAGADRDRWLALREEAEQARDRQAGIWSEGAAVAGEARVRWQARLDGAEFDRRRAFDALSQFVERRAGATLAPFDANVLEPGEAVLAIAHRPAGRVALWATAGNGYGARPFLMPMMTLPPLPSGTTHLYVVAGGHPDVLAAAAKYAGPATISFVPVAGWLMTAAADRGTAPLVVADPTWELPEARRAGRALAKTLSDARLLVGDEATPTALVSALADASMVHYAGHGVLRAGRPWAAHLVLAGGARFDVFDALSARVPGALMVLSGCRTGADIMLARDDALGLPEAFLVAGAQAVVASDRVLPDAEARRFTELFYASGGATRPAAALQAARRALRAEGAQTWNAWRLVGRPTLDHTAALGGGDAHR